MIVLIGNKEPSSPDTEKKVIEMQYLASLVALVVKNLPASAEGIRDPWVRKIL